MERTIAAEQSCLLIIMRHGGLDGVALQKREYRTVLRKLNLHVHVVSGREEIRYGGVSPNSYSRTVLDTLDFYHPVSRLLYANAFANGPETKEAQRIGKARWLQLFAQHKASIRADLETLLQRTAPNLPIFIYNLLSLRHAHAAAAAAIRDLITLFPERIFISHAADPDAERPEKICRIKPFVLETISAKSKEEPYSGGPYIFPNLYHIVINPTQRDNFVHRYRVPASHVFQIPDFLEFGANTEARIASPEPGFLHYLAARRVQPSGHAYTYTKADIDADTLFFLSPVRPVYRKRLREAMLVAKTYGAARRRKVAFVVTHPNADDPAYFLRTVQFAQKIGMPFLHLGENFSLTLLDDVYRNMSALASIGVVASAAGGWENALNEMARARIPFFMSASLNSYVPLTEEMGIRTFGLHFEAIEERILRQQETGILDMDISALARIPDLMAWIDRALAVPARRQLVEHNYESAFEHLSHEAIMPRLCRVFGEIYATHGFYAMPVDACAKLPAVARQA